MVGNGREPEETTAVAGEAELVPAAELVLEPAPEVVAAAVDPDPLALAHPVRASPATAAATANAPAERRAFCA